MLRNAIIFIALVVLVIGFIAAGVVEKLIRLNQRPAFSYEQIHQNLERKDRQLPHNALLLLGDSHVAGICEGCLSRPALNFGIGGDTVVGLSHRIHSYTSTREPTNIAILEIGSNDILWEHKTDLTKDYTELLQRLSALQHVFVFATLPVAKISPRPSYNAHIAHAATQLRAVCAAMKNCSFVVLETIYDNEGYLKAGLYMPDGIHLNEQGYRMWIEHIETLLNDFSNAQ